MNKCLGLIFILKLMSENITSRKAGGFHIRPNRNFTKRNRNWNFGEKIWLSLGQPIEVNTEIGVVEFVYFLNIGEIMKICLSLFV